MVDTDEECERAHLVPAEDDKDFSPPTSPIINQVIATPPSPPSNKVSSGGSLSSRTIQKPSITSSLTPVPSNGGGNSRFLHVSQKLGPPSRRPSIMTDNNVRTPKENITIKMNNMKRDALRSSLEPEPVLAPPNTPNPEFRGKGPGLDLEAASSDPWQRGSATSSQMTVKAQASDSDTVRNDKGSTETLQSDSFTSPEGHNPVRPSRLGLLRNSGTQSANKTVWAHSRAPQRNIQHHSFLTDTTDVRQMEQALLQLLEDFHSGKLRAFAKDGSLEQMQGIREQQERLARLHFDLGARQENPPLSSEGLRVNQENMRRLMSSLQKVSESIEKLQLFSKDSNNP